VLIAGEMGDDDTLMTAVENDQGASFHAVIVVLSEPSRY